MFFDIESKPNFAEDKTHKEVKIDPEVTKQAVEASHEKGSAMVKRLFDKMGSSKNLSKYSELIEWGLSQRYGKAKIESIHDATVKDWEKISKKPGKNFRNPAFRFMVNTEGLLEHLGSDLSPQMLKRYNDGQINSFDILKMGLDKMLLEKISLSTGKEKIKWKNLEKDFKKIYKEVNDELN